MVGVPRSGTTWTSRALGHTDGAVAVNEPDGFRDPFAFRVMLTHGEHPALEPGDDAPDYARLWTGAFAGGRPAPGPRAARARRLYDRTPVPARRQARAGGRVDLRLALAARLSVPRVADPAARHVVVKSVQCTLALDWLVARHRPRVVVVDRHPLNVLASWIELDYLRNPRELARLGREAERRWGIAPPPAGAPRLVQQAFQYGVLAGALHDAAAAHPDWVRVSHEQLCTDPPAQLRALGAEVGLTWGAEAATFIRTSDRPGTPYRTERRAAEQPARWRTRLDAEQVASIRAALAPFPHPVPPDPGGDSGIIEPLRNEGTGE